MQKVHRPRGAIDFRLGQLWAHRALVGHLGWDYVKKYIIGTWLGFLWIPLRPAADIVLRTLVFGGFLGVSTGGPPYLLFLTIGSSAWFAFDRSSFWGYRSLQFQRRYFRSFEVPWATAILGIAVPGAVEAFLYGLIAAIVAVGYLLSEGNSYIVLGPSTALAALGYLLLILYAIGLACFTGPVVAEVRDVRYMLRMVFPFLYFVTPVLYPVAFLPPQYQGFIEINPLTAPVMWVQDGLMGTGGPPTVSIAICFAGLAILLPAGLLFITRRERRSHARL